MAFIARKLEQEDDFSREPFRRLTICLNTNEAFLGSKQLNPFHFRKFNLQQICISKMDLLLLTVQ